MGTSKNRVLSLEMMRIFAAVAVIAIHVFALATKQHNAVPGAGFDIRVFLGDELGHLVAIPSFLFISGYFLWARVYPKGSLPGFYRKRFFALVLPYVIWSLIFIAYRHVVLGMSYDLHKIIICLITGKAYWHLHFMPAFICLSLLAPAAAPLVRRKPTVALVLAVVFCIGVASFIALRWPWFEEFPKRYLGAILFTVTRMVQYVPYFALGAWFSKTKCRFGSALISPLASLMLVALGYLLFTNGWRLLGLFGAPLTPYLSTLVGIAPVVFGHLLGVLGVALFFEWLSTKNISAKTASFIESMAAVTFSVYLIHPLVIRYVQEILGSLVGYQPGTRAHTFMDILVLCLVVVVCFALCWGAGRVGAAVRSRMRTSQQA